MVGDEEGVLWSVERRFRVTEVFLALLWVSLSILECIYMEDWRTVACVPCASKSRSSARGQCMSQRSG